MAFPLPLRNALAELTIAALEDDGAAAALAWLAAPDAPLPPEAAARLAAVHLVDPGATVLLPVHVPHAAAAAEHAQRALRAAAAYPARSAPAPDRVVHAVVQATALWNERLFFEVHEVLEAVWRNAAGEVRQALHGVIQVAVAFHHLAHGNRRGARSLLCEGRARLAGVPPATLPGLDLAALRAATAAIEAALVAGETPSGGLPRLGPA